MGVTSCSRRGCDSVMCDTHIDTIGNICWECKKEFKEFLLEFNTDPKTEREIRDHLEIFMFTEKSKYSKSPEITVDEFFNNNTR